MSGLTNKQGILILGRRQTEEFLSVGEAVVAVEHAFKLKAQGRAIMPPKLYLDMLEFGGDFRAMPAYIDGIAGLKWVSGYPDNHRYNLPTVMATIILCDPETGRPLVIMSGEYITNIRTGAAGGVAVKYLARSDSTVVGMIGAGIQARTQLLAIIEVLPSIKEVKVFDLRKEVSQRYAQIMAAELKINICPVETVEAATDADIVVTTTPSREPVVKKHHIKPGTHISAIGADAKGKQELDSGLLASAKVVVDDIEQASHGGEINVPLSESQLRIEQIYGTIGEIAANLKNGRENDDEITIFDSTGLAIQDIVCAKLVYEKAKTRGTPVFAFFEPD
ncbi:Delta(1)-pyrroline-2-carboxylate reductase [subsurface metagenome]